MKLAIDTNRYVDLCRAESGATSVIGAAREVFVPFIVLAELRAGFALGSQLSANKQVLDRFLAKPGVSVLFPEDSTTHVYGSLFRQLRQQGTPIPTNDIWIAALAIERGLPLFTRDSHFRHLAQLALI